MTDWLDGAPDANGYGNRYGSRYEGAYDGVPDGISGGVSGGAYGTSRGLSGGWSDGLSGGVSGGAREPLSAEVGAGQVWRRGDHAPAEHDAAEYASAGHPPAEYAPVEYMPAEYMPDEHPPQPQPPRPPRSLRNGHMVSGGSRPSRRRAPAARPSRRRRLTRAAVLLTSVLLVASVGTYVWADTRLNREVDLSELADRAPRGKGTNYLVVGSDSRVGLSEQDRKDLHTGGSADAGRRTDSVILLHTGAHGTTMLSLPRDSWVTVPPYIRSETGKHYRASKNKLNAAFSLGGPDLLIRTIERNTGLRIDHYTEIGFAGFVGIVDAIGGVPMCLDKDIKDEKSGADLKKGCHTLDGRTALAFVRQRHQEAHGDLGRSRNQQKFLAALADKAATPGTLLDPSTVYSTASAGLDTLIVDEDTALPNLTSLFKAMKSVTSGNGKRLNVPVSSIGFPTSKGSAVKWDLPRAKRLFGELRNDRPVSFEGES
ncbi:LCP family protein [Streptomyces halobius]|uniref:LCP family protein n=1 Tax=Streptomyces halobius TaxID=2879846 RepID=A0ABY4M8J0_9ACTN|nr:LCP family protein [Streptomyces halobius]UQA94100.1 LCP family protein [Streptomyces halobius]